MAGGNGLTHTNVMVGKHGIEGAVGHIFICIYEGNNAFTVLSPCLKQDTDVIQQNVTRATRNLHVIKVSAMLVHDCEVSTCPVSAAGYIDGKNPGYVSILSLKFCPCEASKAPVVNPSFYHPGCQVTKC
jgi:hypothetical protein